MTLSALVYHPTSPLRWSWVSLTGLDAKDFLHRLTTVHVRALEEGQGAPGCFLTAQGKIRSYFTLWNYGPDEYAFELDGGPEGKSKAELLATIDQYTFGEKITVTDVSGLDCRWIFPTSDSELALLGATGLEPGHSIATEEEIRVCHHGNIDFGRTWITAWGRPERLAQWTERALPGATAADFATLESWRIQSIRPRVGPEINENTIPLEVGLKEAIAQDKGCYPGQEVIERIISLGSPARRLSKIQGKGTPPQPGEPLLNLAEPPAEIGQITSVSAQAGGEFTALGLIKKIHAKDGIPVRTRSGAEATVVQIAPYA